MLSPKLDGFQIKKNEKVGIGTVEIRWQNMFGDIGVIMFGPFIYMEETDKDLEFHLEQEQQKMVLEEPVWVKVSLMNCTNKKMKLELDLDAERAQNIAIHGFSRYSLKKVEAGDKAYFSILIFPQHTGIHTLSGIVVKDRYTGAVYRFGEKDSDIAFEIDAAAKEEENLFE